MLELFRTTPFRGKKKKKEAGRRRLRLKESEPSEPVTVHRTGRSDRGPDGSMLFSHGTVPYLKPTVNLNDSRVLRSDRTVRSGFNNLAYQGINPFTRMGSIWCEKKKKQKTKSNSYRMP